MIKKGGILIVVLSCLHFVIADLIQFRECQKRFGFTKKMKEQLKQLEDDGVDDLDGYIYKSEEIDNIQINMINKEVQDFHDCLKQNFNCYQLIDSNTQELEKQFPYLQCFQKCYNPSQFQCQLMKDLVEFSIDCAKNHLNSEIDLQELFQSQELNEDSQESTHGKQKRQPWGILIFGMVFAGAFVGWINFDRLKNKMNHKKKFGEDNYDLVEIYELNPDYLARKRFEENLLKLKSHHTDFLSNTNAYKLASNTNNKKQETVVPGDEETQKINKEQNEEAEISLQQIEKVQNNSTINQNLEI